MRGRACCEAGSRSSGAGDRRRSVQPPLISVQSRYRNIYNSARWSGSLGRLGYSQVPPLVTNAERPLFILDIFDHDAQLFIDSRACHTVAEGAVAFDEFLFKVEPVAGAALTYWPPYLCQCVTNE
jgi:hypothetical protein